MKKNYRNIKVYAVNNGRNSGFNIYLDFSGQREYLIHHRHNGLLYNLLKDGVSIDAVKRWTPSSLGCVRTGRSGSTPICKVVGHLVTVIDEYMMDREAC